MQSLLLAGLVPATAALGQIMNVQLSNVIFNNLGGQGPEDDPVEALQYDMLLGLLPPSVDLRITNTSEYSPSFNPGGGVEYVTRVVSLRGNSRLWKPTMQSGSHMSSKGLLP
eukprot:scaffold624_cov402-Prasinococcus_capsulatus_cf.AAC.36